jgi:hypothetical protein
MKRIFFVLVGIVHIATANSIAVNEVKINVHRKNQKHKKSFAVEGQTCTEVLKCVPPLECHFGECKSPPTESGEDSVLAAKKVFYLRCFLKLKSYIHHISVSSPESS